MEAAEIVRALAFASYSENHIASGGAILEMVMPSGRKLGECTGEEIGRYGEWILNAGRHLKALKLAT